MLIFAFFARTEAFLQELRKEQRQNNKKWQYTGTPTPTKYFKRCIAMNETAINWDSVPEIITKDQLYKICHISKSTALYLLRSGKIPCEYNGKKTRCYKIKKKDVIKYLENRKVFPECYSAPAGWYRGNYSIKLETKIPESALKNLRQYYTEIIYAFLTIFLYLLKCPQSLILSALRAFCFCGKPHISRSIFLYFRYQTWLKSW